MSPDAAAGISGRSRGKRCRRNHPFLGDDVPGRYGGSRPRRWPAPFPRGAHAYAWIMPPRTSLRQKILPGPGSRHGSGTVTWSPPRGGRRLSWHSYCRTADLSLRRDRTTTRSPVHLATLGSQKVIRHHYTIALRPEREADSQLCATSSTGLSTPQVWFATVMPSSLRRSTGERPPGTPRRQNAGGELQRHS